jgi:pimeloyl-ACP methyl ester carboxylesterase
MVVLVFLGMLIILVIAGVIACFVFLPILQAILATVIGVPFTLWLGVLFYGLVRRSQPLRPFDAAEQKQSGADFGGEGRYITTSDGRIVEYLVYGSQRDDAKVIVQMHGSTTTGGWQCMMNASLCEALNLKGIAPSVPCHGYSDLHIGRKISDFPLDLAIILEAEGVNEFMVEGASFGTAHAMAIAWHFGPSRCVAMGLMVPYLSDQICKEFKLESKADALPKPDARTWYQAWNFLVADLMFSSPFSPPARFMTLLSEGKKVKQEKPWAIDSIVQDQKMRLVARGSQGQGWEQFSFDVTVLWGFDPRDINTKNIAVWYAEDDSAVPPSHGEWLAQYFGSKEGVDIDIRAEDVGYGHFTYIPSFGPVYQTDEKTMPKTLLDLCELN